MTLNRLLITSVVLENRPVRDVADQYGVSESWLFELLSRYRAEGDAAFEPRSRRPRSVPTRTPAETVDLGSTTAPATLSRSPPTTGSPARSCCPRSGKPLQSTGSRPRR